MPNRLSRSVPAVCLALLVVLNFRAPVTAQSSATPQELSEVLAALVRSKWEMIEIEAAGANEEWAGRYQAADGPTITTNLAWSPVSGFIVWWYNCSRPTSTRANHGGAVFENGLLAITPQLSENVPGSFAVASEFVPVKWGAQHFLIPRDQLMKFIYAVNSGSEPEIETFLMKHGDSDKKRQGRPAVPSQYAKYFGMKPITATVSTVGPKTERWFPKVTLNVGKREGLIPEMKFYRFRRGGPFVAFEVTSVDEHTAEADVVMIGGIDGDGKIQLKRGWTLSSRAPKNIQQFYP